MARPSSPTASEGHGINYADKIGALCLIALLKRTSLGGTDLGAVTNVQFAQRPVGWHFDDVLLTLDKHGVSAKLALSIKSGSHVTNVGIAREIVELAWEQLEHGGPFQESVDAMALVQPSPAPAIGKALGELSRWSSLQGDGQTEAWVNQPDVGNDPKRALINSVKLGGSRDDAQRFFRSVRVVFFDVDPPMDHDLSSALEDCASVLRRPTDDLVQQLWDKLCQIAAVNRASAGSIDLNRLVRDLVPHFLLREHPRVEPDVQRLVQLSRNRDIPTVTDTIGGDLRLPTGSALADLDAALSDHTAVFFLGPSGVGKSVVLRHFAEQQVEGELRLYWRADLTSVSPTALAATLNLTHDLPTVLSEGRFAEVTLMVDQVDRLLTDLQLADVTELLISVRSLSNVRVVFGCQSGESERIISRLRDQLPEGEAHRVFFNPDEEEIFKLVVERFPQLHNIAFRPELRPLFIRPKNLDLLVRRLDQLGALTQGTITSQKQFIDWFWSAYVDTGGSGLSRATTVRQIAELQAAKLSNHLSPQLVTDRVALDSLRAAEIIAGDDRAITFQHDLYGDWARLRSIEANSTEIVPFLRDRGTNPLWLRAIRLWSAIVLETEGAPAWKRCFDSLSESDGAECMVRDAMLDGLSLAAGSHQYLTELADVLFEGAGQMLKRFLTRFLFATTWPNDQFARTLSKDDPGLMTTYRAHFRIPQWYLWLPVVQFLIEHPECGNLTPEPVIEILVAWLESIPNGARTAKEASALALTVATDFLQAERYRSSDDKSHSMRLFRCAFYALRHIPSEAQAFLKRAAGRIGEDRYKDAELIEGKRYVRSISILSPGRSRIVGPWPEGPINRPNEQFRDFVLAGGGFREAFEFSPEFAREIVMACLIEPPFEEEPRHGLSDLMPERCLCVVDDHRTFYPPLFDKNLFEVMFAINADFATELILDLTDFTTERWDEMLSKKAAKVSLTVDVDGERRAIRGNADCYTWHRDGRGCSDAVVSALMSLEKFAYDQLDAGSGEAIVERLVARMRSTAILGLLVTIGRKYPFLFGNRLRFLHFNEVIHHWDIHLVVGGEGHQMIGWYDQSEARLLSAQQWHAMPHRRTALKMFAFYVLNELDGQKAAKRVCARWKRQVKTANADWRPLLEGLAVNYDFKNYSFEERDGRILIQCNPPKPMQEEALRHQAESERSILPMMLASRCRQLLNDEASLSEPELEALYAKAKGVRRDDVESHLHFHAEDAWCGVAAVLLVRHRHWLRGRPEIEAWCLNTLIETCLTPPHHSTYEVPQSISEDQWCHFAASALPLFWEERPEDGIIRNCIANLVEEFRQKTIAYLARPLFSLRRTHPELYYQAVRLHRAWSVNLVRQREEERKTQLLEMQQRFPMLDEDLQLADDIPDEYPAIREQFLKGTLSPDLPPLPSPVVIPRVHPHGLGAHDRDRAHPKVDTTRLGCFVVNLPGVENVAEEDQQEIITRWSELFAELLAEIRGDANDKGQSVEFYSDELDLFRRFGGFAASLTDQADVLEYLNGIKEIISFANTHAEQFFYGFFRRLLADAPPNATAEANWLLAIKTLLNSTRPVTTSWTRSDFGWRDWQDWLVGNTQFLRKYSWKEEHREYVKKHATIYETWVRAMCSDGRSLANCLRFLSMAAAQLIRAEACVWIADELDESVLDHDRDGVSDELASFLELARAEVTSVRHARPNAFTAYLDLLAVLNRRNNRLAMQLLDDVATLP